MSEWNNFHYVYNEIKINAEITYNNASKDLQNDKQIFLETIKNLYYQNKGQTNDYIILIPEKLKYDETICKLYSYYMYSMLNYIKYVPDDSNFEIVQNIKNNISELHNYYISMFDNINIDYNKYIKQNKLEKEIIAIFKSLIFSYRKLKDEFNDNNILLKNNYNQLICDNNKLKNKNNKLKNKNNEFKN